MFRLPLDITRMAFIAAGPAEAVTDYATGAAKTDENGSPLFGVEVMLMLDGEAEIVTIKTPTEPKGITAGTTVRPVGLTALAWYIADDQKFGVSYRAASVEAAREASRGSESRSGS